VQFDREVQNVRLQTVDVQGQLIEEILLASDAGPGTGPFDYWGAFTVTSKAFLARVVCALGGVDREFQVAAVWAPKQMLVSLALTPSAFVKAGSSGSFQINLDGPSVDGTFDVYVEGEGVSFPNGSVYQTTSSSAGHADVTIQYSVPASVAAFSRGRLFVTAASRSDLASSNTANVQLHFEP
jgi:hypothetical protein